MSHTGICCGMYRGRMFLRDRSVPNAALLPIGNAEMEITQELTEIEVPNYQKLGGAACKIAYPESVNLAITAHCISPENLAIAFMGTQAQLTPANVVEEEHTVNAVHELIPFEKVPDRSQPIVVKSEDGLNTYVDGEDYVVTNSGIEIIDGTTITTNAGVITVDYSYGANYVVDAQTVGQKEFEFVFDGINVGEAGNRQVVVKAWKVKFNPTDSFAMISGEEFANLNLTGEVLADESKVTGSQYMKFEWGSENSGVY